MLTELDKVRLRDHIARIEEMVVKIEDLNGDLQRAFSDAGQNGFDEAVLQIVLKARALRDELTQSQALKFDSYMIAVHSA